MMVSSYSLTLPTESAARAVADQLADRGHWLVAVRAVGHFSTDTHRPEFAGWWDVYSVVTTEPAPAGAETAAVRQIARHHGGVTAGPGGGKIEGLSRFFNREGLVHELSADEAARRRPAVVPPGPTVVPPAPLAYRETPDEAAELAAIMEALAGDDEPWEEDDDEPADSGDLLGELFNAAMHQGTVYAHTAGTVPDFVALALDERLGDQARAWVYLDLFMISTVGRRYLCSTADREHAFGRPLEESPDAVAARQAVMAGLPRLLRRWDAEVEIGRFFLAALVAAEPEAGAGLRRAIGELRRGYAGTARERTLLLVEALADRDEQRIEEALGDLGTGLSPWATAEQRGLSVLEDLLTAEV
ncbi:hypothetical protein AMIS_38180 [Actinoplanes missouriensis 431]|uniref:Uncharacterized protein n=1 Tax=Actinoplanes missouriensis (strain ATCC 14538 / DSM 43046 / CBS 188.64 / JCM 3121 / NBRC 102363 / NCIMB 12654 / NRRL B-3342 / UNCC 431) TaxID=512565 RepID=I0H7Q1_ACTM4|nr:hypothetical protein [Actinoplanes missouriensis]BAL89038.1 hypothetical protein AMIS_38180 [Actinoplanes missouriensis 431]